jgi:probable rRNA maturation factor
MPVPRSGPHETARERRIVTTRLRLDLQDASSGRDIPAQSLLKRWVRAAIGTQRRQAEISLRIVDEPEMSELNGQYRGKPYPTNVLSFPADLPPEVKLPYLGDIVICAAVVEREALAQGKQPLDHWAHLLIHGTLHLLGFDHIDAADAEAMESREIEILKTLAIANPYIIAAGDDNESSSEDGLVNHG